MTGGELAAELQKRKPGLHVIFTSGYSSELAGKDLRQDGTRFLPKPYQPQQAARMIREIFDAVARQSPSPSAGVLCGHAHSAGIGAGTPAVPAR